MSDDDKKKPEKPIVEMVTVAKSKAKSLLKKIP